MTSELTEEELKAIDRGTMWAHLRTYTHDELIHFFEWKKEQLDEWMDEVWNAGAYADKDPAKYLHIKRWR